MPDSNPSHGLSLHSSGDGPHVVLMLHGWPDTHTLWDATVAALQTRWRCVRFDLPGFGAPLSAAPPQLKDMVALIAAVVDDVSPDQPVTLLVHDWGAVYGYQYALRYPQRVARIVGVDIGDTGSPAFVRTLSGKAKAMVAAYQGWLALAWLTGRALSAALADRMTRAMARALRAPGAPQSIRYTMNYPYFHFWSGGFRGAKPFQPHCPMLYVYGERKPFMFHSADWVQTLSQRPGCAVVGFKTGHWIMAQQAQAFNACISQWLEQTPL